MPATFAVVAQTRFWSDGGHMMGMHWGWWLFWVPVVLALVWALVRSAGGPAGPADRAGASESAEDVLRRRFAEGEIDEEEFRRRMDALREDR